jgi:filamentous hemagglutinin
MLASAKETVVTAADVDNRNGTLSATGSLNLHVGSLENTQGTLVSGGDARIDASRIDNQKGMIVAQGDLAVTAQRLDNDSGGLVQSGGISRWPLTVSATATAGTRAASLARKPEHNHDRSAK